MEERDSFEYPIKKNIKLFSKDELKVIQRDDTQPLIEFEKERHLVVLLTWLHAKPRHAKKYVDLYLNKGFDVLKISTRMWDLFWPTYGSQVTASCILQFLYDHDGYQTVLVHGLSCGNYVWSEVLVKIEAEKEKFQSTLNRIKGQVFDSPPCPPPDFQNGFSIALFPNNLFLSLLFKYAMTFQLFLFYSITTKHLKYSYEVAKNPPKRIPSLMFISKDDPIAPFNQNILMYETLKKNGVMVDIKWWEKSPHVGHYQHHQEEYVERLNSLLESIGLNNFEKINRNKSKVN